MMFSSILTMPKKSKILHKNPCSDIQNSIIYQYDEIEYFNFPLEKLPFVHIGKFQIVYLTENLAKGFDFPYLYSPMPET